MRKIFILIIFSTLLVFVYSFDINNSFNNFAGKYLLSINSKQMNVNNISTWWRNSGSFNRDPVVGNAGFIWPKSSYNTARYVSGFWIGGIVGTDTCVAVSEYSYDYVPGYIDLNGNYQGQDSNNKYHIFEIDQGDTLSDDYLYWPGTNNSTNNQGAYVDSARGKPLFMGDQTMFYKMTDGGREWWQTSPIPLKLEVLQTNWCYKWKQSLKDVLFTEIRIINRNSSPWTNAFICFWTDDDLGNGTDDKAGCDTLRNFGYTYNATNNDGMYGAAPPTVGTLFLRKPYTYTGNNNDTVYYFKFGYKQTFRKIGYKEKDMYAFNSYYISSQPVDPQTWGEAYNIMSGKMRNGTLWINPITNLSTRYVYSGDPVTNTGWVMTGSGNDVRFLQSFGPLTIAPFDTQTVVIAQLISRGSSNLNSITTLRQLSDYVTSVWKNNIVNVGINNQINTIPTEFRLSQNYPNPFNPSTNIRYQITNNKFITLKIFDIIGREVETLVNEKQTTGIYEVTWDASKFPSGVYFYRLGTDNFNEVKRMILIK